MHPIRLFAAVSLCASLALAAPAWAQGEVDEARLNLVIVYGEDKCPESDADTITVCARKSEDERFRIPESLRERASPQNEAWTNRVLAYETIGRSGAMSCSATGAGSWTGCQSELVKKAYAEKAMAPEARYSQLVAEARAKRLATIDKDAAETQSDVEMLEEQIEARRRLERQAAGEATPQAEPARAPSN